MYGISGRGNCCRCVATVVAAEELAAAKEAMHITRCIITVGVYRRKKVVYIIIVVVYIISGRRWSGCRCVQYEGGAVGVCSVSGRGAVDTNVLY